MASPRLLEGEEVLRELRPHPLSFASYFALPTGVALYGVLLWWLYRSSAWAGLAHMPLVGDVGTPAAFVVWWAGVLLLGVVDAVLAIRWRSFFLLLGGLAIGTGLVVLYHGWRLPQEPTTFIPLWTILLGAVGVFLVELFRQSHRYTITNYRLIFQGGLASSHERSLRYTKVTDVDGTRSLPGRLLGFGTIIPITASGFGLGADLSFAGLAVGGQAGKGGAGANLGVGAGGGREVSAPRARSYYALHGVWPYGRVKQLVEGLVQENTDVPYMRRQAETLERIEALLAGREPAGDDRVER